MAKKHQQTESACILRTSQLSYEVHTGRELQLMLQGQKPLSVFSEVIKDNDEFKNEDPEFEQHVLSGDFAKCEVIETWDDRPSSDRARIRGHRLRIYALKNETWRIQAYLLLKKVASKGKWNDALERLEGSLLGYTDEQNDEWLRRRHESKAGWGCFTLYALTTGQTLAGISELGMHAFPREILADLQLFYSDAVPARSTLTQSKLLTEEKHELIRFGVTKQFFESSLEQVPSESFVMFSPKQGLRIKELNQALATDIQIIEPV